MKLTHCKDANEIRARRLFLGTLAATAVVKLVAAALIPLTGDEAYFLFWGRHPALGYYDHGPMTGWWLAAMLQVSDAAGWIRLPAVLLPFLIAWWLQAVLRPRGRVTADLAATLFLLSPFNLATILMTTDIPLLAFTMMAGISAVEAARWDRPAWWLAAGFWLGLAFLAKYFAVLIGVAWIFWMFAKRPRPRVGSILLVLLGAAPAVALNVWWNHRNGWTNVLFNLLNRNEEAGLNPGTPLLYLISWAVVLGPAFVPLIIRGLRLHGWREGWRRLRASAGQGVLLMAAVPAGVFALVAMVQDVGLHWLMAFLPWAMLVVLAAAPTEHLACTLRAGYGYAGLMVLVLGAAIWAPTAWLQGTKAHSSVIYSRHGDEVRAALAPHRDEYRLVSSSYTRAGLLAYHLGTEVPVLGAGSFHGRQDDLITDFRALDGQDLMMLSERDRKETLRPWFQELEVKEVVIQGLRLELMLGRGFRYEAYRQAVLQPVAARYYAMPAWLARWSHPGDFVRRYGLVPTMR